MEKINTDYKRETWNYFQDAMQWRRSFHIDHEEVGKICSVKEFT